MNALFDDLMAFMDDPIADSSIFPTYLLCRFARQEVKVCLSGDGGDELFGGYETYLAERIERVWHKLPRWIRASLFESSLRLRPRSRKKGLVNRARRFLQGAERDDRLAHARWRLFVDEALRSQLFTPAAQSQMPTAVGEHVFRLLEQVSGPTGACGVNEWSYVDARSYLPDNCLVKVDRMSMACSLEVRVPFLDHQLVDLACQMPATHKLAYGRTKPLLKRIAARHVPPECVYRPKEGFSAPVKSWLRTELRERMSDLLSPDRIRREHVFEDDAVARLQREHLEGREDHSHLLWGLMVFQDWRDRWNV